MAVERERLSDMSWYNQYVVTCDGCKFRKEVYTVSSRHAIAEVLWLYGCIDWGELNECMECGGQLKVTLEEKKESKASE